MGLRGGTQPLLQSGHSVTYTRPHPPPLLPFLYLGWAEGGVGATASGEARLGGHPFPQKKQPKTWVLGASLPRAQLTVAPSTARSGGPGNIKTLGDAYEFAVDVSDFSPEDIIVTTSNNHIEVRAEKVSRPTPSEPRLRTYTLCPVSPLLRSILGPQTLAGVPPPQPQSPRANWRPCSWSW